MSDAEQEKALEYRQRQSVPWHSPPHRDGNEATTWMFTASCYEHRPHIGKHLARMASFEAALLEVFAQLKCNVFAWVVLPKHYHVLADATSARPILTALGRLHGRSSYQWNGEDAMRGRKVWFNVAETGMKSDAHYWASINYIHHNPVKHGYAGKWLDWPFSSAAVWLEKLGRARVEQIWKSYPVGEYGKGWDD